MQEMLFAFRKPGAVWRVVYTKKIPVCVHNQPLIIIETTNSTDAVI